MNILSKSPLSDELEVLISQSVKALRLQLDIDQRTLATRAMISLRAVKNLEGGLGTTLRTFVSVLRALGREDWLKTLAPVASVNPLSLTRQATPRQRASKKKQS
jgi:transcriptional regulator with XRE-family HTH domain